MPTCSQAKIITNLETDIQKRLFALTRAGGGTAEGGGGGGVSMQYGDPSGENLENDENFYETIQNLNNHHPQQQQQHHQQQQYSPSSSSSHQNHINTNAYTNVNDLNEINKLSSLAANLNVNENFKIYQSFHRPTKTLASPSTNLTTNNNNMQSAYSGNNININTNTNAMTTITSNTTGRKLGLLKNQSINNNNTNDSKSINNNNNNNSNNIIISNGKLINFKFKFSYFLKSFE